MAQGTVIFLHRRPLLAFRLGQTIQPALSPSQQQAHAAVLRGLESGACVRVGGTSRGVTTLLRKLQSDLGGQYISLDEFFPAAADRNPLALEETLFRVLEQAFASSDILLVDDLPALYAATCGGFYPRSQFLHSAIHWMSAFASRSGKKVICADFHSDTLKTASFPAFIGRFTVADYAAVAGSWLAEDGGGIDFEKVYRFAPRLNAHQLRLACCWLRVEGPVTTERFIDYLRSQKLASNVDLEEVQDVELHDLLGVDSVIRALEVSIALPLENDALANRFGLRPKRGVLLFGPPGTGKTTVGRALAHRLRGKFFLIDGTFIAGTQDFYMRVHRVFEAAKDNAPSVIFIDDADSIFEDGEERGLYRYLLTMLDGLESESSGRVCVFLTAMNVNHLPPALVRSGRVELWLEMKLPDAAARTAILARHVAALPADAKPDLARVVEAADGFTGADLKRTVEDAKGLCAFDLAQGKPAGDWTEYLLETVETVRANKALYEQAEVAARSRPRSAHPAYYGGWSGVTNGEE